MPKTQIQSQSIKHGVDNRQRKLPTSFCWRSADRLEMPEQWLKYAAWKRPAVQLFVWIEIYKRPLNRVSTVCNGMPPWSSFCRLPGQRRSARSRGNALLPAAAPMEVTRFVLHSASHDLSKCLEVTDLYIGGKRGLGIIVSSSLLDEPLVVTPLTKAMRRIPIDADEQWRRIFVFLAHVVRFHFVCCRTARNRRWLPISSTSIWLG